VLESSLCFQCRRQLNHRVTNRDGALSARQGFNLALRTLHRTVCIRCYDYQLDLDAIGKLFADKGATLACTKTELLRYLWRELDRP